MSDCVKSKRGVEAMKELVDLKFMIANQKTISTKKLGPLIDNIQKAYINTSKKVAGQEKTIKKINGEYSRLVSKNQNK